MSERIVTTPIELELTLNGQPRSIATRAQATLLECLRNDAALCGSKEGCGEGECGACTVFVDGEPVDACLVMAAQCAGSEVTTIEGLGRGHPDGLHPVQRAFIETGAVQCGFCIPGMIMSAAYAVDQAAPLDVDRIRRAIAGNICRCTGYRKILEAVTLARQRTEGSA
jgi:aerobic-type carbon monoxide dehydrogenase small subunit (CoxS/CutS family)